MINRAIALKRLGRVDDMMKDIAYLELNGDTAEPNIQAGVAALKGDRKTMFLALKDCLHSTVSPEHLKLFPVFEDYQEDSEFLELIKSSSEQLPLY